MLPDFCSLCGQQEFPSSEQATRHVSFRCKLLLHQINHVADVLKLIKLTQRELDSRYFFSIAVTSITCDSESQFSTVEAFDSA